MTIYLQERVKTHPLSFATMTTSNIILLNRLHTRTSPTFSRNVSPTRVDISRSTSIGIMFTQRFIAVGMMWSSKSLIPFANTFILSHMVSKSDCAVCGDSYNSTHSSQMYIIYVIISPSRGFLISLARWPE